jgi:bacteriocin biosynthesis cyclodehydratase domain-containing protein
MIPVGDGQVVLKDGVKELLLTGAQSQDVAQALVDALDVGLGVADVLLAMPAERRNATLEVLRALAARGMLSDSHVATATAQDDFYRNFGPTAEHAADALSSAHVVVRGLGVVSRTLVEGLVAIGVGRVTAIDDPGLRGVAGGPDLREADGRIDLVADAGAAGRDADLLVAASDIGQELALLEVAREALAVDVPFLPAWVSEMTGYVGPLTHPFETACLRCYQLRVDANDPNRHARRALRRHVAEHPSTGAAAGLLTPMAAVVAHIAVMEVVKEVAGFTPVDAVGRSIEINLVSFRSTVRRVLKLPRCPDCGEPGRRTSRTVFTGVQIID